MRKTIRDLKTASGGTRAANDTGRTIAATKKETLISIGGVNVERLPGMTGPHADDAKRMAEKAYPALYVFENSARDVIAPGAGERLGTGLVEPGRPEERAREGGGCPQGRGEGGWHGSRRGVRDIDYVLLTDLAKIVRVRWSDFEEIFPRPSWFEELVSGDINVPRRLIAHMQPLSRDDVNAIETAFRKWAKQLKARADMLP